MTIRLVLVRHGLSSFNAKGLIQGRTDDSLLTEEGYQQALKAGKALSNINFKVEKGSVIGVVGSSGSGKSTMLKMLTRLYEIKEGQILIDDNDISKVDLYSLRSQIGVVPQDSLLFDGSVMSNIALARPDATFEEVVVAAQIACAHEFIQSMPAGYNSSVGERGAGMSGGQRQRMAIARMIIRRPRLLVLDEATSALDVDTERRLTANLIAVSYTHLTLPTKRIV